MGNTNGLLYNEKNLNDLSAKMSEAAKDINEINENRMWLISLPTSDVLMLNRACHNHLLEKFNLSEEEYQKYSNISQLYVELNDYYRRADEIKERQELGITMLSDKYDASLTEEEAFLKYAECTKEYAQKIYELMKKINKEDTSYITTIREQYTGDLAKQLGMDREQYKEAEQKVNDAIDNINNILKESLKPQDYSVNPTEEYENTSPNMKM